jgi:hypothetical protein
MAANIEPPFFNGVVYDISCAQRVRPSGQELTSRFLTHKLNNRCRFAPIIAITTIIT